MVPWRAVVFDLDGTLIDSSTFLLRAFQHAVEPFRIPITDADLEQLRSRTPSELFLGYLEPESNAIAIGRLAEFAILHAHEATLFPGIKELLSKLHSRQISMAVWTGRDRDSAVRTLEINGLQGYFQIVVGNACVPRNKPHPDGLLKIADHLGLKTSELIMIGDHEHDLQGARSAGVYPVLASWGHGSAGAGCGSTDKSFRDVTALLEWLC